MLSVLHKDSLPCHLQRVTYLVSFLTRSDAHQFVDLFVLARARRTETSPLPNVVTRGVIEAYDTSNNLVGYVSQTKNVINLYALTSNPALALEVDVALPQGQTSGSTIDIRAAVCFFVPLHPETSSPKIS